MLSGIQFVARKGNADRKKHKKEKKSKKSKKASKADTPIEKLEKNEDWMNPIVENQLHKSSAREAWMTTPMEPKKVQLSASEKDEIAKEALIQKDIDMKIREPVTRMPYGLYNPKQGLSGSTLKQDISKIGDGGASWRGKMLKRAKERADEDGTSLHEAIDGRLGTTVTHMGEARRPKIQKLNEQVQEDVPMMDVPDMNKLASQILKAKLKGDTSRQKELEQLLKCAKSADRSTYLDERGRGVASKSEWKDQKVSRDDVSLEELRRREKVEGVEDMDDVHAKNIIRLGSRYMGTELGGHSNSGFDEEDKIDVKMFESSRNRLSEKAHNEKAIRSAKSANRTWDKAIRNCQYCMKSQGFKKHLLLSLADHTYLSLIPTTPLTMGHCYIAPIDHIAASNACDEQIWQEIVNFKQSLRHHFRANKQGVIFLEKTFDRTKRKHCVIECIPVPLTSLQDAELYFKHALNEVDEEWSTHQKIIPTHIKGLRRCIPENFPYFHVEWDNGGYAHVIDDERQFPSDFGVNVIAGMIHVDPPKFNRVQSTFEDDRKKVLAFISTWSKYDWTKELDGGDYA